uniref:ATP-grasp fold PylC-type domain-containing protein n=1 Tax=viral metagenome TaxID=1070528 RepID=A0A6C0DZQ2_9ZZZZ
MKLIIPEVPFTDWNDKLKIYREIIIKKPKKNTLKKIMPLCVASYIKYNDYPQNIFKNNLENIQILDNKSKFAKFMIELAVENIPETIYYNFTNTQNEIETYNNNIETNLMIYKPNVSYGGIGIKIINKIIYDKNIIISKYIKHKKNYVGHFLVLDGIIQSKIYFLSKEKFKGGIKKGRSKKYVILDVIDYDDSIFHRIFEKLNYSGFACGEFIIKDGIIKIFEINPRMGGSLVHDKECLNIFIKKLLGLF